MRIARLKHKLRRFGELSGPDKGLLLRAVVWLAIARVRLAITPFPKLVEGLSSKPENKVSVTLFPSNRVTDTLFPERVGYAVRMAAANVPWRSDCFPQTIAAYSMLKRYGYSSTVHLGVERVGEDDLLGHAWLTCADTVVTGGAELDRYTEVHRLSP